MTGLVCSIDHLASEAGARMMDRGGNAVDAALAANAVLAVTAPHLCGMGGDLFALVYDGSVRALNASGRAGSGASAAALRAEGHSRMPMLHDIRSVTVPGCVDGWLALHDRARLSLAELFAPAIALARDGFEASPLLAPRLPDVPLEADGTTVTREGVARTLEAVASDGRDGFYRGEFGAGLVAMGDGLFAEEDLAQASADWVDPLRTRAFGHDVWTTPPNSQGYLLLLALEILDGLDLPDDPSDAKWTDLLVEVSKAAAYDRPALLFDGAVRPTDIERRRALVGAGLRAPAHDGDTTYLCSVDGDGLAVSLIQSNAAGFGSLLWEPTTGINLHNRGIGFSLEEGHPAEYAPGRRPPHTLLPALVTRPDGSLRSVLGTMGGDAQPQIVLQLVVRLLRHQQSADDVISAPRWRIVADTGFDTWVGEQRVEREEPSQLSRGFGHAHLIDVLPDGSLDGAADPRALIGSVATARGSGRSTA